MPEETKGDLNDIRLCDVIVKAASGHTDLRASRSELANIMRVHADDLIDLGYVEGTSADNVSPSIARGFAIGHLRNHANQIGGCGVYALEVERQSTYIVAK